MKVYKDATQTFLLAQTEWLVPVAEGLQKWCLVKRQKTSKQSQPNRRFIGWSRGAAGSDKMMIAILEQTEESNTESTDTRKNEETVEGAPA